MNSHTHILLHLQKRIKLYNSAMCYLFSMQTKLSFYVTRNSKDLFVLLISILITKVFKMFLKVFKSIIILIDIYIKD